MNDKCLVTIKDGLSVITLSVDKGTHFSDILGKEKIHFYHPCGGTGKCGKCGVIINGRQELSCRYIVNEDITALIPQTDFIETSAVKDDSSASSDEISVALDIGTTTLAAAIFNSEGKIIKSASADNPQRKYGADVISRIAFCAENGVDLLQSAVLDEAKKLICGLLRNIGCDRAENLYVAGNSVMLHLFLGVDCSSMGTAPYVPVFLDGKEIEASDLNFDFVKKIITLPCIDSFAGADVVSGLVYTGIPEDKDIDILLDLGTNAECVIYSSDRILCTSAAAGPCFEGVNISCGMSAVRGAICTYRADGSFDVIGGCIPTGICATGLIDIMAYLIENGIVDRYGKMKTDRYEVADDVFITQEDVRQYQLAKSAVYSAVSVLVKRFGADIKDIRNFYVAGGISSRLNPLNAVKSGLFPKGFENKFIPVNNSSVLGLVKFGSAVTDISSILKKSEYIDLSVDSYFSELFVGNMMF